MDTLHKGDNDDDDNNNNNNNRAKSTAMLHSVAGLYLLALRRQYDFFKCRYRFTKRQGVTFRKT
jgi:hypothetical protein